MAPQLHVREATPEDAEAIHALLREVCEGEYGVEWSLVGMRVGEGDREISRTRAPARDRDPHSYLSIELLEDTREVVLAVTNLSGRGPDADEPDDHARSFRLTVDRAGD